MAAHHQKSQEAQLSPRDRPTRRVSWNRVKCRTNVRRIATHKSCNTVAALGAPGQMIWLEDPPPWLRPAYCFASVIVWTANKNVTISEISETVANLPPDLYILNLQFNAPNSISVAVPLQIHWATGVLTALPDPYVDFRGPTFKGSKGRGRGEKGKGRGGNEKVKGREGRQALPRSPPLPNLLRHWIRRALFGVRDSGWPDLAWGFFWPRNDLAPLLRWRAATAATGEWPSSTV